MNRGSKLWPAAAWGCCLAAVTLSGCGGDNELQSPTAMRLQSLAKMYLDSAITSKPATNEQEFRNHLKNSDSRTLDTNGVDLQNPESIFTSLRDNEPFVVRYGTSINNISGLSAPLLAYEKTGKSGKRLVVFANAKLDYVDDSRLQDLIEGKHLKAKPEGGPSSY